MLINGSFFSSKPSFEVFASTNQAFSLFKKKSEDNRIKTIIQNFFLACSFLVSASVDLMTFSFRYALNIKAKDYSSQNLLLNNAKYSWGFYDRRELDYKSLPLTNYLIERADQLSQGSKIKKKLSTLTLIVITHLTMIVDMLLYPVRSYNHLKVIRKNRDKTILLAKIFGAATAFGLGYLLYKSWNNSLNSEHFEILEDLQKGKKGAIDTAEFFEKKISESQPEVKNLKISLKNLKLENERLINSANDLRNDLFDSQAEVKNLRVPLKNLRVENRRLINSANDLRNDLFKSQAKVKDLELAKRRAINSANVLRTDLFESQAKVKNLKAKLEDLKDLELAKRRAINSANVLRTDLFESQAKVKALEKVRYEISSGYLGSKLYDFFAALIVSSLVVGLFYQCYKKINDLNLDLRVKEAIIRGASQIFQAKFAEQAAQHADQLRAAQRPLRIVKYGETPRECLLVGYQKRCRACFDDYSNEISGDSVLAAVPGGAEVERLDDFTARSPAPAAQSPAPAAVPGGLRTEQVNALVEDKGRMIYLKDLRTHIKTGDQAGEACTPIEVACLDKLFGDNPGSIRCLNCQQQVSKNEFHKVKIIEPQDVTIPRHFAIDLEEPQDS